MVNGFEQLAIDTDLLSAGFDAGAQLGYGLTVHFDAAGARVAGKAPVGRVLIDDTRTGEVGDEVLRDRRHLAEDGLVVPVVAINKQTGKAETPPEIITRGFISENSTDMMEKARQVVLKTLESSSVEERGDTGVMQEKIRVDLKRFLNKQTQRRPLIMPVILEV